MYHFSLNIEVLVKSATILGLDPHGYLCFTIIDLKVFEVPAREGPQLINDNFLIFMKGPAVTRESYWYIWLLLFNSFLFLDIAFLYKLVLCILISFIAASENCPSTFGVVEAEA